MTKQEEIIVDSKEVSCDGGNGSLGHPKVFLNMGKADKIECPYCGRHFVASANAKAGH